MGAQQSHAPAHVPDPPPGTPQGTLPSFHGLTRTLTSGGNRAGIGINLVGQLTGNSTLAHFTPPNPSEGMHNLTQAFQREFHEIQQIEGVSDALHNIADIAAHAAVTRH